MPKIGKAEFLLKIRINDERKLEINKLDFFAENAEK